jgi:hypothetical protein
MVRLRFQTLDPESGRDSVRFEPESNLTEPDMHNFAKIFLFRMDKMMIHPDFVL